MGIVEGEAGVMAICSQLCYGGVRLNSTGDSDEASSCLELLLGAWARLEVRVGLQLTGAAIN